MFQRGTQTAVGRRHWRRHGPEAGAPTEEENLALRVGAKRRRRIQEMLRSNQHSTTTDGRESQATPRVTYSLERWADNDALNKDGEGYRGIRCPQPGSITSPECDFQKHQLTSIIGKLPVCVQLNVNPFQRFLLPKLCSRDCI